MTTRVFGPVRGAGTQIREVSGDKPIVPGALGWRGYAGMLEKGPTDRLIFLNTPDIARRRIGSFIDESQCPDAIFDSFNIAAGAGGVVAVRVTDGTEAKASIKLYMRNGSKLVQMGTLYAHNGGRWGGKERYYSKDLALIGDLTNTTLDTKDTTGHQTDEWKGGYVQLAGTLTPTKQYPIVGNTSAGVVTVASDQTMLDDLNAGTPADLRYYLVRLNEGKALSVEILDGDADPDNEFTLLIYVDGIVASKYENLSVDPNAARYWVNIINDDTANYEVSAEQVWTGAITAAVRPANHYGLISTVTELVLTAIIHDFTVNSPGGGDPTIALGTTTDEMLRQRIVVTMTSPTAGDAVSDIFGAIGTVTLGTPFDPPAGTGGADKNKLIPPFTVTAGGTALAIADTLVINYKPFVADSLIGGFVYPDKVNAKRVKFRIVDNDHVSITAADGSDLTADGAASDEFMVTAPIEFSGGRDGNAGVAATHYIQAFDTNNSYFNRMFGKNMGLVKLAAPGVSDTTVQKAGVAYAAARNYQYRIEIPSSITTENEADEFVNDTVGRSPYMAVIFPSYAYVLDPLGGSSGRLKLSTRTGEIHGREARMAVDAGGYHRAEAGVEATLPTIVKLQTEDRALDEELLNPRGIPVIKVVQGNYVIWGARIPSSDPEWVWKHQRELMCYYENVLRESFDWIIFQINNPEWRQRALQSLRAYFRVEYLNGVLDQNYEFERAAIIKIDEENNPPEVRAAGDMKTEISLALPNTVERFVITISKAGIYESVG